MNDREPIGSPGPAGEAEPEPPVAEAAAPSSMVDGEEHHVDPRSVTVARVIGLSVTSLVVMAPLVVITIVLAVGGIPGAVYFALIGGWLVLASDAAHFYENLFARKPFPIVVDMQDMLDGFVRLEKLASDRQLIIPGHDPLVGQHFPGGCADHIWRLDRGPKSPVPQ